jgi:hypothetical protein
MDHTTRVRELDRVTDIDERTQQALAIRSRVGEQLAQRDAGEPLHRKVRATVG